MDELRREFYQSLNVSVEESRKADDRLRSEISQLVVSISRMQQQMVDQERPCPDHVELRRLVFQHIEDDRNRKRDWAQIIPYVIGSVISSALIGALAYAVGAGRVF